MRRLSSRTARLFKGEGGVSIEELIDIVLLGFLSVTAVAVLRLRDLLTVVLLFGIYGFLTAGLFMSLDAVDVAFTEAAVGAGVSTVLMLSALRLTQRFERRASHIRPLPLTLVLVARELRKLVMRGED